MPHRLHIQDHPRVCGEKHMIENSSEIPLGSPPRVRGKAFAADALDAAAGITPACAGKRSLPSEKRNPVGDHPRVCGEKWTMPRLATLCTGSPPRVRGKELLPRCSWCCIGITPACAGKSILFFVPTLRQWDHPRVCGEKGTTEMCKLHKQGSPPRVRGKGFALHVDTFGSGITPACAGKRM